MEKPIDIDTFTNYDAKQVSEWALKILQKTRETQMVIETTIRTILEKNLHGLVVSLTTNYKELVEDYDMPINTAKILLYNVQLMKEASSKKNARTSSEAKLDEPERKNAKLTSSIGPLTKIFRLFVPTTFEGFDRIHWSAENEQELIERLLNLKEINNLEAQKKVFGGALKQPLPCYAEGKVFEWLLYNPLTTEFEQFEKIIALDQNEQEERLLLLHQVSGSGKTKFAYHLSTNRYVVVLRLLSPVDLVRDIFAMATSSPTFKDLSFTERIDFAYCSLYITFSWIYAHLAFLELYQKLAAKYLNDRNDVHQLFQLIQWNGSPAHKFIHYQFKERMMKMPEFESGVAAKGSIVALIRASVDSTKLGVIVFDELLSLRNDAIACFFHNSMLYKKESTASDMLFVQQQELESEYNIPVFQIKSQASVTTTRTSLVTGFMAILSELKGKVQVVITDTSKEVEHYFIQGKGLRPERQNGLKQYTPHLYFNLATICAFLNHYFDLKLGQQHERLLKHFRGRALFFVRFFFFEWLLSEIKACETGDEVAKLLAFPDSVDAPSEEAEKHYLFANSTAFRECTTRANDYLNKFLKSSVVDDAIKQEIRLAFASTAGVLDRSRFARIEKDIGQLLGFLLQKQKKNALLDACVIAEPFIADSFKSRASKEEEDADQDFFFKRVHELLNQSISGKSDGVDVGLLLERTIARIFQRHNGQSFLSIFKDYMQMCGIDVQNYEDLFINCTTAGKLSDFKIVDPLLTAWSFAEWANLAAFLFPPNTMKPDGIVMLKGANSMNVLCMLQMKCYEDHLTPATLVTAINTLNPNNFYKVEGKKELNKLKEWQQVKPKLENLFAACIRIVVSSAGFSEQCFALVREYNKNTKAPIILYTPNATDIGRGLFTKLNIKFAQPSSQIPIAETTDEYLQQLNITYSKFDKEASKKKTNKQQFLEQFFSKQEK